MTSHSEWPQYNNSGNAYIDRGRYIKAGDIIYIGIKASCCLRIDQTGVLTVMYL